MRMVCMDLLAMAIELLGSIRTRMHSFELVDLLLGTMYYLQRYSCATLLMPKPKLGQYMIARIPTTLLAPNRKTFPNGLRHFSAYLKRKNLIHLHRQSQTRLGEREVLWQGVLLVHRLLLDTDNQMGLHNDVMRLQIMSGLLDSANEVLEILMMFNGCRKMK